MLETLMTLQPPSVVICFRIDFRVQNGGAVYALEVKAEENLRAKSLRAFKQRYPEVRALRFSLSHYREQEWMRNIPLYAMGNPALWG